MLNKRKGFTLLELMISIGILILLTAMSVVGYRRYQWSIDFRGSLNSLASDIKLVQQEAITNKYPDPRGPLTTSYRLDSTGKSYTLSAYHKNADPPVALIKTVILPGAVKLSNTGTLLVFDQRGIPIILPGDDASRLNPVTVANTVIVTLQQPNLNIQKNVIVNINGGIVQEKY
jgi:type II secretory pathway pseudopilin PulG